MESFHKLIKDNTTYIDVVKMQKEIEKHLKYKTCIILLDAKKEIYAFCRWNIVNEEIAEILDLIIRSDYRNKGVMFEITRQGLKEWPRIRWLVFERGYDDGKQTKKLHKLAIERFMRREQKCYC